MKILNQNCSGLRKRPIQEVLTNCIRSNQLDLIVLQETHFPKLRAEEYAWVFGQRWSKKTVDVVGASGGILLVWNANRLYRSSDIL